MVLTIPTLDLKPSQIAGHALFLTLFPPRHLSLDPTFQLYGQSAVVVVGQKSDATNIYFTYKIFCTTYAKRRLQARIEHTTFGAVITSSLSNAVIVLAKTEFTLALKLMLATRSSLHSFPHGTCPSTQPFNCMANQPLSSSGKNLMLPAEVERAEAAERKKAEKQRRRDRKAREEAERTRAITRLREDYRNSVNAVRSGQYRMNWTPTSTMIRIARMGMPGEQAPPPFVSATFYESTRAVPPPMDPRLQRQLQPAPTTLRPPATRAPPSTRPPTPAPAARPPSLFSGGLLPLPPPPVPPTRVSRQA
uniref:Uncharacterized protein n=1 Tax=Globodera rostochiensis TaxID=31243 RepID=A0A914HQC5_GLORO